MELSYELTNDEHAPASARRAVERDLGEMVEVTVLNSLCVVVSEIVTRGVRGDSAEPIGLWLRLADGSVRGEIRVPGLDDDRDGSLGVLDALTQDWGIEPEASRMWFEVSAEPAARAPRSRRFSAPSSASVPSSRRFASKHHNT